VHEIEIVPNINFDPPRIDSFVFRHTHCRVSVASNTGNSNILPNADFQTESVALIEDRIIIGCAQLAFSLNVWRSSLDSVVGFFPRLVRAKGESLEYLPGFVYVLWNAAYSIMLPKGLIMHQKYMKSALASAELTLAASNHPHCIPLLLALWPTANNASPPIWIDIPTTSLPSKSAKSHDSQLYGNCFKSIVQEKSLNFRFSRFPVSQYKVIPANQDIFW